MSDDKQLKAAEEGLRAIVANYERSTKRGSNCAYYMMRTARNYLGYLDDLKKREAPEKPHD